MLLLDWRCRGRFRFLAATRRATRFVVRSVVMPGVCTNHNRRSTSRCFGTQNSRPTQPENNAQFRSGISSIRWLGKALFAIATMMRIAGVRPGPSHLVNMHHHRAGLCLCKFRTVSVAQLTEACRGRPRPQWSQTVMSFPGRHSIIACVLSGTNGSGPVDLHFNEPVV